MDVQPAIIDSVGEDKDIFLERTRTAVEAARKNNVLVIFVVVGFREGFLETHKENKVVGPMRETKPSIMVEPKPLIDMEKGDILVTKRRVSAFSGSDLEVILRANGVRQLVLGGIMTSGVVLSTVREAADKDYAVTVLSDLCGDPDPEVQKVLLNKVFPWQADVMTSQEWAGSY